MFLAENPIVRVTGSFSIVKEVVDPNGVVDPAAEFTGTYSCQYGTDPPVTGTWAITPAADDTFTVPEPPVPRLGVHGHRERSRPGRAARRLVDLGAGRSVGRRPRSSPAARLRSP